METHPLAPAPPDSPVTRKFLDWAGLWRGDSRPQRIEEIARAFSQIPYENLTKILKHAEEGTADRARRGPEEVLSAHIAQGAGGTCFSLTACLLHILRSLGWPAEPILADRRYGTNTHCALVVQIEGRAHLLDAGYLILRPVPLPSSGEVRIRGSFNDIVLVSRSEGTRLELHTEVRGQSTYRLTFRTPPADAGTFLGAWNASFDWDMMRYPVLTRMAGESQLYLQDRRFQVRGRGGLSRSEIDPAELVERVAADFGLEPGLVARALGVLRRGR